MNKILGRILTRIPYIRYAYLYKHNTSFRPGHYYSPVADVDDLKARQEEIWAPRDLPGIDMNSEAQRECLRFLLENETALDIPMKQLPPKRYYGESASYPYVDGVVLQSMLARFKPRNVMEVGSGFSSGGMLDVCEKYGLKTQFTFIEPEPKWCLSAVLRKDDYSNPQIKVIEKRVQEVHTSEFSILQRNDILFIDSSHVSKPGSDVNYLLTQVLPRLNSGVIVHFHDIYYPFEYTKEYLLELGLLWSEVYSVHNFLLFNDQFKILFFSDYMRQKVNEDPAFAASFPQAASSAFCKNPIRPKNLWIQRV